MKIDKNTSFRTFRSAMQVSDAVTGQMVITETVHDEAPRLWIAYQMAGGHDEGRR